MTNAEATIRFAILDGISTSFERIQNPERLVERIYGALVSPTKRWALGVHAEELESTADRERDS